MNVKFDKKASTPKTPQGIYLTDFRIASSQRAFDPIDTNRHRLVVKESISTELHANYSETETAKANAIDQTTTEQYWQSDDLDSQAQPVGEWEINLEALPVKSKTTMRVQLWISSAGKIDRWELLSLHENTAAILECLAPIDSTVVNAARIHGQPTASIKLIEISIERD
ncbi:MAG: hypothetical protein CFE44_06825 [Burkholderiales bacterium PBB4]|nr:MAG: hypothetical protein CFE44_06825 [Burkholderiales bacterium PBB4]